MTPSVADFGDAGSAAMVLVDPSGDSGLPQGMAQAGCSSLWTTGESVEMEFLWDSGGNIAAGIYDVRVDVDGRPGEGWIRNVDISGSQTLEITVDFNAE